MDTRENTIGVIHWDGMFSGTDGERISVVIPAFFQEHQAPYLAEVLAAHLGNFLGDDDVSFGLKPGKLTESPSETHDNGHIVITGIREPWPDGTALRHFLEDALEEAGEVEEEQSRRAKELVAHLRATGGQSQQELKRAA